MPGPMFIPILIGVGVIVVVAMIAMAMKSTVEVAEDRLEEVTGRKVRKVKATPAADSLLKRSRSTRIGRRSGRTSCPSSRMSPSSTSRPTSTSRSTSS